MQRGPPGHPRHEWWIVIVDVVAALTDSADSQGYVKDMRRRDPELAKGWGRIATPLSIATVGGPQNLNCANTEGLFRVFTAAVSGSKAGAGLRNGRCRMYDVIVLNG